MSHRRIAYLVFILLISCGEPIKSVLGDWQWIETTGGLLPARTPENVGKTARLTLERNQWTYYENGLQAEQFAIKIKRKSVGLIIEASKQGHNKIVDFINDNEITITYYGGPNSDCQDCAVRRFVRL